MRFAALILVLLVHGSAAPALVACPGDCSRDDAVTIDELQTGVAIALDARPPADCVGLDGDADGRVTVDELLRAVGHALRDDCYAAMRDPASADVALAREIAAAQLAREAAETLPWDWGEAVLMHALVELSRVTGEARYRDYAAAWIDHHVAAGYAIDRSDSCPPALVAIALYQRTGAAPYRNVVDAVLHYLYDVAPRTADGGIGHTGTILPLPPSLWVDSLFMFGTVLARWGEAADDARALQEYATQFAIFADRLQTGAGYFRHADGWPFPHDADVFWARGNGWAAVSAVEYLRVRQARRESDALVAASARRLLDAVVARQDATTGLWWTVADAPGEGYVETSASALFAYALARGFRYGLLDESPLPALRAARRGLADALVRDGLGRPVVTAISGPTIVQTRAGYLAVPVADDRSYGVGAVILALIESSGLPR